MVFSYKWLKEYLEGDVPSPEKIAEVLTAKSFEVERFEKVNITFQASAFSSVETYPLNKQEAKQCALFCVDEIINNSHLLADYNEAARKGFIFKSFSSIEYWQEVKQEIEKL